MNPTAIITLILTFAITAPVIFIIANPHWLSYWRRRWVRLAVEPDVANLQQPYFTDLQYCPLLKSPESLVLLSDPGSGKSVTLRQFGLKLAN